MLPKLVALLLLCSAASAAGKSYKNYKVYDVETHNEFEKQLMQHLSNNADYDFFQLTRSLSTPTRVMVQPKDQQSFERFLLSYQLQYSIVSEDLAVTLERSQQENLLARSFAHINVHSISFTTFKGYAEINAYLNELAKRYPKRVSVRTIGKSYEQRYMKTITISNGDGRKGKNVNLLDAGIHAREWITPAATLYVIYQLVENFTANSALLNDFDWIILPVVNPDGYEYSHTHDRMWRSTRKPMSSSNEEVSCIGADINRNFDFHWGEVGASRYSCSDTYKGQSAFSEAETRALRDLMLSLKGRGKLYLTLHSFGPYIMYPWAWTNKLPDNWHDHDEVAQAGAVAIAAATGTNYTVGSCYKVAYPASGTSQDYAYAVANFTLAFTMELPAGKDFYNSEVRVFENGFCPHPDQILPLVNETWIGIKAMAEKVMQKSAGSL